MPTYRELLGVPAFRAVFLAQAAGVAAVVVSGLALATVVYRRTGSPLLAALTMFGSSLGQLLGATLLLSAADRVRPRPVLVACSLLSCVVTAVLAVPHLPVVAVLLLQVAIGAVAALAGAVRWSLLDTVLPAGGYVLARSALNMSVGLVQVVGYVATGLLLSALSSSALLGASCGLYALGALALRGVDDVSARATGRATVARTLRTNGALLRDRRLRPLLLASWVPNGLVVGAESLYVPYAPRSAGLLFSAAAAGMLAGDLLAGRLLPPAWRLRLATPLRLLLAAPYLVFAFGPPVPVAAVLVAVASVGYSATLLQQERMVDLVPAGQRGHLLGLQGSGMLTLQAVGATVAGALAQGLGSGPAMVWLAAASLTVSGLLTRGLSRGRPGPPARR